MKNDLFPEMLLVDIRARQAFTTSLKVAEFFNKRHTHVLRAIEKLAREIEDVSQPKIGLRNAEFDGFSQRIFTLQKYEYKTARNQNREAPFYEMTRDGFALLTMGFTGREALNWKIRFLNAFNAMEAVLDAQLHKEATALYRLRPHWKTVGDGVKAKLSRAAICAQTGHRSPNTITATKRRMRFAGLL